ncbi:hypothetical protein A1O3_06862 [Capronia epimyces CBS 606.96]|uniref:Oxidoreductase n=1 Tax=Capronia epimyces CBS 606.96 TaxID=1182542 RepID=W9Y084_9EURO|nr:uncharacterized protein A1O3_06862 [Capronia epimyces CBS 606.96]EXJ83045.1 hypothetical protein A1O3_06862 [Capronia epimyces CBS 606.96]
MDPIIAAGVALVTGSGSVLLAKDGAGIGQEIALGFARNGCRKFFLADIVTPGLETTKSLIEQIQPEAKVVTHKADVSNDSSVQEMIDTCIKEFGRLDFACNNAGIAMGNTLSVDVPVATFDRVHNVNLKGIFLCHKYEIAAMLKQEPLAVPGVRKASRGSIVNTASMASHSAVSLIAPYTSSKHGVLTITREDARQFGKDGIRINCVSPGYVDTPLLRGSGHGGEYVRAAEEGSPMKRLVDPAEVADGVVFLSGSAASAITGVSLPVDGGALLYHMP